jgi:cell division protein ZapA
MASINVMINGRSYRVGCEEGQEQHLLALAAEVNGHVDGLKGTFGEIGDQRLTVMAALMVADQLSETRRRVAAFEEALAADRQAAAAARAAEEARTAALVEGLTAAAERIERLTAGLGARDA